MDDRETAERPRGKVSRLIPPLLVVTAVAIACALGTPGGGSAGAGGPEDEGTPEDSARFDSYVERFRRGQQLFGGGRDAEAEALFRELLEEQPDAAAVHHALAFVQWFRGDAKSAIAGFQEAARLAPEDGAIRRDLGLRLVETGAAADAVPHLEAAERLLDADVETLCGLGRALDASGRPAEAERKFRAAHALDPDSIDARALLAQRIASATPKDALALLEGVPLNWPDVVVARAAAFEHLGRFDDAKGLHARLAEIAPAGAPGVPALRDAAEGLVRCGAAAEAVQVAVKWTERERSGDRPSLRSSVCLAVARAGTGDAAGALAALDASPVPESTPAGARAHLVLVRVHLLAVLGRPDDARALLRSVSGEGTFESDAARYLLGGTDDARLAAAAKKDPRRANDVAWLRGVAALLSGRPADAVAPFADAGRLTSPPGEHPGLLVRASSK